VAISEICVDESDVGQATWPLSLVSGFARARNAAPVLQPVSVRTTQITEAYPVDHRPAVIQSPNSRSFGSSASAHL
jgi:hypothetical protein